MILRKILSIFSLNFYVLELGFHAQNKLNILNNNNNNKKVRQKGQILFSLLAQHKTESYVTLETDMELSSKDE